MYCKRRSRKKTAPVLSSSLGARVGSQQGVLSTLAADWTPGDSEDGCGKQPESTLHHPSRSNGQGRGPRFFPLAFAEDEARPRKKRVRTRKHNLSCSAPENEVWRCTRARLKSWKRLRKILVHHLFIPEEEEHVLIALAENEGVKDNEDGLEGWTAFQLMNKVSEGATAGFEILTHAVEDIISNLSSKAAKNVKIRSSNITQWRPETQKWLQAQSDDVILIQETHLTKSGVACFGSRSHAQGWI